jgi:hypothetical protein
LSLGASTISESPVTLLRYIDVVLIVVAAPILLLIGVPAVGYGAGAGAWIALRAVGIGVERYARSLGDMREAVTARIVYPIVRIFVLALTVIFVKRGAGKDDALAALAVIVFAFTIHLALSFAERPRAR